MSGGAPVGNQNGVKSKRLFAAALKRLFTQDAERADRLAVKLATLAEAGEGWAFKELVDRLDGKVPQPLVGGDDDESPISVKAMIELVRPENGPEIP